MHDEHDVYTASELSRTLFAAQSEALIVIETLDELTGDVVYCPLVEVVFGGRERLSDLGIPVKHRGDGFRPVIVLKSLATEGGSPHELLDKHLSGYADKEDVR